VLLHALADHLDEACLVSAYDIAYGHLGDTTQVLNRPQVVFIDSGGYECEVAVNEPTALWAPPYQARPWSAELYRNLLSALPKESPTQYAVVSYDLDGRGQPVRTQIELARLLLDEYPRAWSVVLLKPRGPAALIDVAEVLANASLLTGFSIIGVAEKELGSNLLARVKALINLRVGLDAAGVRAPVHLFGALDPVLVPVYFMAGAEVFDGLSWLRFGFREGIAIYLDAWGVLELDPSMDCCSAKVRAGVRNLVELERMKTRLLALVESGDISVLKHHREVYAHWANVVQSTMGGR